MHLSPAYAPVDQLAGQLRQQGYAEDHEEFEDNMRCLAAPIRDRFGHVIGGMSVSFPCFRFREELKQDYVKQLIRARRLNPDNVESEQWPWPVKLYLLGRSSVVLEWDNPGVPPVDPRWAAGAVGFVGVLTDYFDSNEYYNEFYRQSLPEEAALDALVRQAGGECRNVCPLQAENALRGRWRLRCSDADLAVAVTLSPTTPAKVTTKKRGRVQARERSVSMRLMPASLAVFAAGADAFHAAVAESGIVKRATCHSLRHSFACSQLNRTGDLRLVQTVADFRRYLYVRPFTLAVQGLHNGKYGRDSDGVIDGQRFRLDDDGFVGRVAVHQAGILAREKEGNAVRYSIRMPLVFDLCALVCNRLREEAAAKAKALA